MNTIRFFRNLMIVIICLSGYNCSNKQLNINILLKKSNKQYLIEDSIPVSLLIMNKNIENLSLPYLFSTGRIKDTTAELRFEVDEIDSLNNCMKFDFYKESMPMPYSKDELKYKQLNINDSVNYNINLNDHVFFIRNKSYRVRIIFDLSKFIQSNEQIYSNWIYLSIK